MSRLSNNKAATRVVCFRILPEQDLISTLKQVTAFVVVAPLKSFAMMKKRIIPF